MAAAPPKRPSRWYRLPREYPQHVEQVVTRRAEAIGDSVLREAGVNADAALLESLTEKKHALRDILRKNAVTVGRARLATWVTMFAGYGLPLMVVAPLTGDWSG